MCSTQVHGRFWAVDKNAPWAWSCIVAHSFRLLVISSQVDMEMGAYCNRFTMLSWISRKPKLGWEAAWEHHVAFVTPSYRSCRIESLSVPCDPSRPRWATPSRSARPFRQRRGRRARDPPTRRRVHRRSAKEGGTQTHLFLQFNKNWRWSKILTKTK